jgi:hypothetical protein
MSTILIDGCDGESDAADWGCCECVGQGVSGRFNWRNSGQSPSGNAPRATAPPRLIHPQRPSSEADLVDLVEEFVSRYAREYDFYGHAAELAASELEIGLQAAGIRCMVTWRAKGLDRLLAKCRQREKVVPYFR